MGLFDAPFGKRKGIEPQPQAQSSDEKSPAAIAVVFARTQPYTAEALQTTLRSMSPALKSSVVEDALGSEAKGVAALRVTWGEHSVDVVGFDAPMPPKVVENCVASAYYPQDKKAIVRSHQAHALLYYGGEDSNPIEQYVALSAVAAAFAKHHAVGVLNESGMISLPADLVLELATSKPNLDLLRHLPLLMLYCGYIKYFMPDDGGLWMRTYNCPKFGLPDLAMHRFASDKAEETFELFTSLLTYLQTSGKRFAPGHTAQFGDRKLRFRAPRDDAPFPTHTAGTLLVVED